MKVYPTLRNRERTYDEDHEFAQWDEEDYFDEYTSSFQSSSSLKTISEQFKVHAEKSLYRIPGYILPCRRKISMSLHHDELQEYRQIFSGNKFEIHAAKARFCPIVAIKKVKRCIDNEGAAVSEIINEMQLLTKLQHPNIIAIKGARISGAVPFVVLEQLGGGTLFELLEIHKRALPLRTALDIAHQLVSALHYLHEDLSPYAMIIHRDLHPQNIGFTARLQLKLFDFGISTIVKKRLFCSKTYNMTAIDGNTTYMAPEALNKETYNEKVDIFSYGVILRLLLTGDAAAAMSENDVVEINVDQSSSQIDNDGSESKRSISTAMQLLIDQCTASEFYIRPTCSVILSYLEEEKRAMAASFSLTAVMLRCGLDAISMIVSRIFRPVHKN